MLIARGCWAENVPLKIRTQGTCLPTLFTFVSLTFKILRENISFIFHSIRLPVILFLSKDLSLVSYIL